MVVNGVCVSNINKINQNSESIVSVAVGYTGVAFPNISSTGNCLILVKVTESGSALYSSSLASIEGSTWTPSKIPYLGSLAPTISQKLLVLGDIRDSPHTNLSLWQEKCLTLPPSA